MGYGELAQVLIDWGVTQGEWGGGAVDLEANIKQAVRQFRSRGPISTMNHVG